MSNNILSILNDIDEAPIKYHDISKYAYKWHDLSYTEPEMSDSDYKALKEDIILLGRIHTPVIIYQNKVLDGRHRQKACIELSFKMPIIILSKEYNISDLREVIRSKHMNRNKTMNQKIIQAYRFKQTVANVTWERAATRHGVNTLAVKRVNTLYNLLRNNGCESDFNIIIQKFEHGMVLVRDDFGWLQNNTSSFSGVIKQFKNNLDKLSNESKLNDIDSTEVDPKTGEYLKKDNNPFIEESMENITKEELLAKYKELAEEYEKLKNTINSPILKALT